MQVEVLLRVVVEDLPERELGPMDPVDVQRMLPLYTSDALKDLTRKEFNEPWRVRSVEAVNA